MYKSVYVQQAFTSTLKPSTVSKIESSCDAAQATVTVDGRDSPHTNDGGWADDDSCGSDSRGGAGMSSSGPFMCTPQSFPPTPVSRAHVMARTSQFADDILFLARDQLRLGENLKAGVDETVSVFLFVGFFVFSYGNM